MMTHEETAQKLVEIAETETQRPKKQTKMARPKPVEYDEAPSDIVDHPFVPKGEWYTLCKHCNLAQSAHRHTTLKPEIRYVSDDMPEDE